MAKPVFENVIYIVTQRVDDECIEDGTVTTGEEASQRAYKYLSSATTFIKNDVTLVPYGYALVDDQTYHEFGLDIERRVVYQKRMNGKTFLRTLWYGVEPVILEETP